jgi:uncharacterized protein (TIGR02679 family)
MEAAERLERLLGGAGLQRLRARLRSRFERGSAAGTVVLAGLDEVERDALCGLLGRRSRTAASMRFEIVELDTVLRRAGLADSLRDALELLDGPIVDSAAMRAEADRRWRSLCDEVADPRLAALVGTSRGLGLLKRLSARDAQACLNMCRQAGQVLARLPVPMITRSQLAADVLGDAHALDPGRPVATIVLAALRKQRREEVDPVEQEDSDRSVWAAAGVLVNELARPVLFLNLPTASGIQGERGEPSYLSLRALLRVPPPWRVDGRDVFVCENPGIVAIIADALGEQAPPLVCTDGMPAAAQRTLLTQLRSAGAVLRYHGDFDWAGIAIGNFVMAQFGAAPWRFRTADYVEAVQLAPTSTARVGAERCDALWDSNLAMVIAKHGLAIHEEAVTAALLGDLE